MIRFFILVLSGWLGLFSLSFAVSEAEMEKRLKNLFNEFRCPTCQGLSVKDSEAGFSVQIRNKIEEMLKAGASDAEIKAYFVKRYGEWILRSPPKEGFNLLLWILPGFAIVIGWFFLYRKSRLWIQKYKKDTQEEAPLTEEEKQIVEADLRRYQRS